MSDDDVEETEFLDDAEEGAGEQVDASGDEVPNELNAEEVIDIGALAEVQDKVFEEIQLPSDIIEEAQAGWNSFIQLSSSRDAAGEAIYAALFDAAPSLQSLFKTPRSVMAMRFMNGLTGIINALSTPSGLKVMVETLGFQHLDLDVTVPRVAIFRDAIVDLFDMELGTRFTSKMRAGLSAIMNYVGGAIIYIRREYAGRIRILNTSWRTACNKDASDLEEALLEPAEKDGEGDDKADAKAEIKEDPNGKDDPNAGKAQGKQGGESLISKIQSQMQVPKTFNEMFLFNAAVMGFGNSAWMHLVLEQFDAMVTNVANSYRLQEECDVLSLVLAQYEGEIILSEFKAVMLASLRSLVPKDWDSAHEVAWNWFWENVERMLKAIMGKPTVQQASLERFIMSLDEDNLTYLRREIYKRFFTVAPAGQDHFKQSTTRLYWIADKVIEMTSEMYRDPKKLVEDISALGLRHVGYGIPTEFFAPFVSSAVDAVRTINPEEIAQEAFRWSLTLVSKILVRTILEGSTIVMKAINTNDAKQLRKAISVAPRGKRAAELLNITVGTQSISPLYWAIESGSLNTAKAMLEDLLVIRADRDNYYYGCDQLFERHPEIIHKLNSDAPNLLRTLLDGLVWRSRLILNGQRRVNYYVKHLVQDTDGGFNQGLEWIVEGQDPKIICHDVVVLFADMLWSGLAGHFFLLGRCYFLVTLAVFITGQSILPQLHEDPKNQSDGERIAIFTCRILIYVFSMGQLFVNQVRCLVADCRSGHIVRLFKVIPLPEYLTSTMQVGNLALMLCLLILCTQDPIFHCINSEGPLFTQHCDGNSNTEVYSTLSMVAMLLYWALLLDLTIFSMQISAFTLVCGRVLSELGLFIGSLIFLIITFASSISALNHNCSDFTNIPAGALSLMEISLGMFPSEHFHQIQEEVAVLLTVSLFIIVVIIFLLNLLVAQLNGAYGAVYDDMVGYARLTRGSIIVSALGGISRKRWDRYLETVGFEERLEFNEGDVGLAGGIQVTEPANEHPTTVENIRRFGGSTSPAMPWPNEEHSHADGAEDKLDRLEKIILRATKKMTKKNKVGGSSSQSLSQQSGSSARSEGSDNGSEH